MQLVAAEDQQHQFYTNKSCRSYKGGRFQIPGNKRLSGGVHPLKMEANKDAVSYHETRNPRKLFFFSSNIGLFFV